MKKTTKVILSSALTMGLCASLIAGSTLAMFSSRSNVNVAITSGKVDVVASVDEDSLTAYSTVWNEGKMQYEEVEQRDDHFHAGGFYSYSAGALTFTNIAAGDAVEFKLNIENKSTLAIQYRVQLTVPTQQESGDPQGDLVKEMQVSFDGGDPVTIGDESTIAQKWSEPVDVGAPITAHTVKISVPAELEGNQGESCLLHVSVYAVQLGTHTSDPVGTYKAYTANDLLTLINNNTYHLKTYEGETIALGADIDLSTASDGGASTLSIALADTPATIAAEPQRTDFYITDEFKGTLDGNGHKLSNFSLIHDSMARVSMLQYNKNGAGLFRAMDGATVKNLVLSNVTMETNSNNTSDPAQMYGFAGILAGAARNSTIENVRVENGFVGSTTNYANKCWISGGQHVCRTQEEADGNEYPELPVVAYDKMGALFGWVGNGVKVSNVNITLNEDAEVLTGNKLFGHVADGASVTYGENVTVTCVPAAGLEETLTFTQENSTPNPTVDAGSKDALSALAESVKGGRDYEGVTVTLSDDIDLAGSELATGETKFSGTIEGNGKIVSGLDLNNAGLLSGANVNNAKLQFTADATTATVGNPDSELETIAENYKNTTVTVANGDASYTITYDEEGMTAAAFNGNTFEEEQELAENIAYSFDGVTFVSLSGTANKALTLANSIFGTASEAIMLADVSPVLNVTLAEDSVLSGNKIYGDVTVNGTATLNGNTVTGTLTLAGSVTLEGNTLTTVAMGEGAKALFAAGNTIDGKPVSYQEGWKESGYAFVGWNIVFNDENKIQSGTVVLGESGEEAWNALLADDAEILTYDVAVGLSKNAEEKYVLGSAADLVALNKYLAEAQTPLTVNAVVTNDINMAGVELSADWTEAKTSTLTLDGQRHVIYGISHTITTAKYLANTFFTKIDNKSSIKDLYFLIDITTTAFNINGVKENVLVMSKPNKGLIYFYKDATGAQKTVTDTAPDESVATRGGKLSRALVENKEQSGYTGTAAPATNIVTAVVRAALLEYLNGIFGAYLN